jgi:Dolichyl-phosphate-mannose-protein mannosyltransferase
LDAPSPPRFNVLTLQPFNAIRYPPQNVNHSAFAPFLSSRLFVSLFLTLVLALNFAIRWHLRDMPLERDEGEYAYAGQLILQGIPPYKLAFNMKFPGSYFMYALIMGIFGQSAPGIHIGIFLVTSLTALLIFSIGRELLSQTGALFATATYVCLAALPKAAGLAGHATHFVSLFVCAGVSALLVARKRNSLVWWFVSGTAFGLGILMKQHAVFFPAFILVWFIWKESQGKTWQSLSRVILIFCAGCLLPLIATAAGFACAGLWHAFVFWTFQYARQYVSMLPLRAAPGQFATGFSPLFESGIWAWIFGIAGLICILRQRGIFSAKPHIDPLSHGDHSASQTIGGQFSLSQRERAGVRENRSDEYAVQGKARALASIMFLAGMAAACPGFYFRNHYFLMAMPGLALLNAAFIITAANILKTARIPGGTSATRWLPLCLAGFIIGNLVVNNAKMWFETSPGQLSKELYRANPFAEAITIANYLKGHTSPTDTIGVLGSEPEIFFLSHRHSASGYIYMYSLTEPQPLAQQMGREFISQIETAKPKYVVSVNMGLSWYSLITPQSFRQASALQDWWAGYSTNYNLIGAVKISRENPSQFIWNESSPNPSETTNDDVLIYQRTAKIENQ